MTLLFTYEQLTNRSPQAYALYLLLYISYLGFSVVDFLVQAIRQPASTRRGSVRIGLRVAAAGCVFALIYAAYKTTRLVDLDLGAGAHRQHRGVLDPGRQVRLQRHCPLWQDLSTAMPHLVLSPAGTEDVPTDSDFLLQRRVIEISDGVLALRPYRSREVQETVQATVNTGTVHGAATVGAAILKAALADRKASLVPDNVAPRSAEAAVRKDLQGTRSGSSWWPPPTPATRGVRRRRPTGTRWSLGP